MEPSKRPTMNRKLVVCRMGVVRQNGLKHSDVTEIVSQPLPELRDKDVLIRNRYVGINASDVSFPSGRFDPSKRPPFDAGFEGLGEIVSMGPTATRFKPGQFVTYSEYGAFAEYIVIKENVAVAVPACDPRFLTIPISGLTASISLEKHGQLLPGQTVLVTAAAGGTGQYAVQLAKLAGCHVIGTCSSRAKENFLRSIGCDRPVDSTVEDLHTVVSREYPRGVDVVYECVGGEVLQICVNNLARFGRLLIIGQIATYKDWSPDNMFPHDVSSTLLLTKSASLHTFVMFHYFADARRHARMLAKLLEEGKIQIEVDRGARRPGGPFVGLEAVSDAIDYMYERKNIGKIVVEIQPDIKSNL